MIIKLLKKYALYIAFLQAWASMMGSLYFSEILGYAPCTLCWYQRIVMYPLVIILFVAILRKDKNVAYYALPLSIIGAFIALYQYFLQFNILPNSVKTSCSIYESCSQIYLSLFGFITIPLLSFLAFLVITVMLVILLKTNKK